MKKILLILFIGLFFLKKSSLSQQISLSISPPIIQTVIKPGKSIMIAYNLKNFGDPVYLQVKVVSFEPKDNLGNIRLKNEIEGPIRFSLDNSDINFERPFFLKNNQSQQILLRIRVPENTQEGDYYYTLISETIPSGNSEGISLSQSKATVGSNILITVSQSGIIDIKPKIVIFDVLSNLKIFGKKINIFDSFDKVPLLLIIENKGKNFIVPRGEITLKNTLGQTYKYEIIPKNILSESQRLIQASPSAEIENKLFPDVSLILSGFFIGKNDLSANINFGENSAQIFGKTTFFAFPFKITFILIIIILLIFYLKNKFKKK